MHLPTVLISVALLISVVSAAATSNDISATNSNISAATELLSQNADWSHYVNNYDRALLVKNAQGQNPKTLWLGCADSRVPESVLTQSMPGNIFVARNIANQFNLKDDSIVSILTYAIQALGVEHVAVVGHTSCGGVIAACSAAMSNSTLPNTPLNRYLKDLTSLASEIHDHDSSLNSSALVSNVTAENVKHQVNNIVSTDVIKANWNSETSPLSNKTMPRVSVHGWIYNVTTGLLHDLSITQTPP